jgi:solute carrier family 25 (adenine nucleotide translocator) protein 4/5/6/31
MAPKKDGGIQQVLSDLAVGGISGAITKTAMSPIERVKILMQTQDSNPDVISGKVERYKGIGDCFSRVNSEQGVKAFWRGNLVNCIRYAPQQGSALAFNDAIKQSFPKYNAKTEFWQSFGTNLFSGGLAGGIANTICYPFDFARTRLASDVGKGKKTFNGIGDCIMKTVNSSGITGLYRGWSITVAGAFVYRAGQLGTFAQIMAMNPYKEDKGIVGMGAAFVCAQVARNAVMPFNYPFDTVRRRVMLESEKPPADRIYKGSFDCAKQIMAKEGFKGMYKGMIPELARGVGGSMVIVAYDRIKEIFGI